MSWENEWHQQHFMIGRSWWHRSQPSVSYANGEVEMGYSGMVTWSASKWWVSDYPAMFYKMKRRDKNGDFIVEHYLEAADEAEARNLESLGYRQGQVAAIEYVKSLEHDVEVAAAERAYRDRNMSDKAKAEAAAADAATMQHVAEVPVTPIKKRGRPRKVVQA
jgi:hypothetical protein